jgi:hypothetical protein
VQAQRVGDDLAGGKVVVADEFGDHFVCGVLVVVAGGGGELVELAGEVGAGGVGYGSGAPFVASGSA